MSNKFRLVAYGAGTVVAFDAIASLGSRVLQFQYTSASSGSYIIYATMGFFAWRAGGFGFTAQMGAILGLVDATAGWAVSTLLKATTPPMPDFTLLLWVIVAITVMVTGTICALIGGFAAKLTRRTPAPAS